MINIKDKLKELPKEPGCYLMKNINNEVIYVGKAKNLSNRVKSYFMGSHNAKTTRLVMDIVDFDFIITSSEVEAFILEINLIKKYRPKYNIMLMDDKLYPYICISNEKHPKIYYTRDLKKNGKYFGPYPNAKAAKATVDMLNKIYPLRKCNKIPKKECIYYHINNCLAPCIKNVDKNDYLEIINKVTMLLRGNVKDEIRQLKQKMMSYSDNLEFEKAIEIKNIINDLEVISEKQKMETNLLDSDIFNYAVKDEYLIVAIFHLRDSKIIAKNSFTLEMIDDYQDMFINLIIQFYLINNNPIPKEIIIPNINIESIPDEVKNHLVIPKKGKKKELLDLVIKNINQELENTILKANKKYETTIGATIQLAKLLNLEKCRVIEAFDNSNILGESAVSAMVSYVDGVKSSKDYRKYRVKTVVGADDVNTFIEIMKRRYGRLKEAGEKYPDLIIIDGGKLQVIASIKALKDIDISIPVMGLKKDDNHRTDTIIYNDQEIIIEKKSALFRFLTNIQDEVHRYAISFHHNVHSKNILSSKLDEIKGIGKVKKKMIMEIIGDVDFSEKLNKLPINDEIKTEILKIYNPK